MGSEAARAKPPKTQPWARLPATSGSASRRAAGSETGAGGFIGHHLVSYLKGRGYWVRGADLKRPEYGPTEADEFLLSAESVLTRLYATSYDLEQFREAIQYCEQGHRRFPDNPTFTECTLWLMGAPRGMDPDPAQAWETLDQHLALLPEAARARARIQDQLLVAATLARAQLPDSARAVIARSQASPAIDPERELLGVEALVYLALGDPGTAVERLKVYLTASPEHRSGWRWSSHWWWRDLQSNPEFRRLIGG